MNKKITVSALVMILLAGIVYAAGENGTLDNMTTTIGEALNNFTENISDIFNGTGEEAIAVNDTETTELPGVSEPLQDEQTPQVIEEEKIIEEPLPIKKLPIKDITLNDGAKLVQYDNKSLSIGYTNYEFKVNSSTELYEIGDIRETKEWGYEKPGFDIITSEKELEIIDENYICVKETTEIKTLARVNSNLKITTKSNPNCIYYPKNLIFEGKEEDNQKIIDLIKITQLNENSVKVEYPFDNYDPTLVNYSGTDLYTITSGTYELEMMNGTIRSLHCTESDDIDTNWCSGGYSGTSPCGGMYGASPISGWIMDRNIYANCTISQEADFVSLNCTNSNARNYWTFYNSYWVQKATSPTRTWRNYYYMSLPAKNGTIYLDTGILPPAARWADSDSPNKVIGIGINTTVAPWNFNSSWMIAIKHNDTQSDFDYGAGVDQTGIVFFRTTTSENSEIPANNWVEFTGRCLPRNESESDYVMKYTDVLTAFRDDTLFDEEETSSNPVEITSVHVTPSDPSNDTNVDWAGSILGTNLAFNYSYWETTDKKCYLISPFLIDSTPIDICGLNNASSNTGTWGFFGRNGKPAMNYSVNDYTRYPAIRYSFTDMTFDLIMKKAQNNATGRQDLISQSSYTGGVDVGLLAMMHHSSSGSQLKFRIGNNSGYSEVTSTSCNVNDLNWHHIVFIANSTSLSIFCDGNLATKSARAIFNQNMSVGSYLTIGSYNANSNFFNGTIERFAVFNYSKGSAQISQDYQEWHDAAQPRLLAAETETGESWIYNAIGSDGGNYSNKASYAFTVLGTGNGTASETDGRTAIESGANSALTNPTIDSDVVVYVVYQNGTHSVGTYDKFVSKDSKRWAFNYLTGSDVMQGLSQLQSILFFWENQNLNVEQIEAQAGEFINSTN